MILLPILVALVIFKKAVGALGKVVRPTARRSPSKRWRGFTCACFSRLSSSS